jgi:hypothetical protein
MPVREMNCRALLLAASLGGLLALSACGDDDVTPPPPVDAGVDANPPYTPLPPFQRCPGDPGCTGTGDDVLYVGAAREDITPVIDANTEILTGDLNGDGEYQPGETFRDTNGNGQFDGVWMAGFGNGRGATGVHDPQYASVIALRQNDLTIALVSVDCVGLMKGEMDKIRELVADADIDYVSISATHSHEARDTIGMWGVETGSTGLDPAYMQLLREHAETAIRAAVAALEPANVQYATYRVRDLEGPLNAYVGDKRDPIILDDEVRIMRFLRSGSTTDTIATMVNWSAHPEYTWDSNTLLSSDYPHALREGVSNGVSFDDTALDLPGIGGITVFFQGEQGSQIGPNGLDARRWGAPADPDAGVAADPAARPQITVRGIELAQTVGEQLAWGVLHALEPGGGSVTDDTADLAFANRMFYVPVENKLFLIGFDQGIFDRVTYNWDSTRPASVRNRPQLLSEVAVVDIGRSRLLSFPGELDPCLFLGGYFPDAAGVYPYTPEGIDIIDPTSSNPPDLTAAPVAPYLRDIALAGRTGVEYVYALGLTNDFFGYLIPAFDYKLDPLSPYFAEAPGDHYEETNSIGPAGWPLIEENVKALLAPP